MPTTTRLTQLVIAVLAAVSIPAYAALDTPTSRATAQPAHRSASASKAKPAASAAGSKRPITFSLSSTLRQGNLVVLIDDVPVFNEEFKKPALLISQTTTWDPLPVSTGKHKLVAKVYGAKKTYISATFELDVRKSGMEVRFRTKSDGLTIEPAS